MINNYEEIFEENYSSENPLFNELFLEWFLCQCNESDESCKNTMPSWSDVKKTTIPRKSTLKNLYLDVNEQFNNTEDTYLNASKPLFHYDGIIDNFCYKHAPKKILFLTNESNFYGWGNTELPLKNRLSDFRNYHDNPRDDFGGRMKSRICYLYLASLMYFDCFDIKSNLLSFPWQFAKDFAFMNLNKRGGLATIKSGNHLIEYYRYYNNPDKKEFIKEEIILINPDIIIWLGNSSFDNFKNHSELNFIDCSENKYFISYVKDNKRIKIPLIRMCHTSYWQIPRNDFLFPSKLDKYKPIFNQATIDSTSRKQMIKLWNELEKQFG